MKYVLVTGASTGIGWETCLELAQKGYYVFGTVRKSEDMEKLDQQLGAKGKALMMDVTDIEAIQAARTSVEKVVGDQGLFALINNAGIAASGPLQHITLDEYRYQFEVNLFGVVATIQNFLPLLGALPKPPHPPGRIINVSSVSGSVAMPFVSPYVASKFALNGLSHSLRRELKIFDIPVVILAPGRVKTPIWQKESATNVDKYSHTHYQEVIQKFHKIVRGRAAEGLEAPVIAQKVAQILEKNKPKAHYIIASQMLKNWYIPRYLPTVWFDHLLNRLLK